MIFGRGRGTRGQGEHGNDDQRTFHGGYAAISRPRLQSCMGQEIPNPPPSLFELWRTRQSPKKLKMIAGMGTLLELEISLFCLFGVWKLAFVTLARRRAPIRAFRKKHMLPASSPGLAVNSESMAVGQFAFSAECGSGFAPRHPPSPRSTVSTSLSTCSGPRASRNGSPPAGSGLRRTSKAPLTSKPTRYRIEGLIDPRLKSLTMDPFAFGVRDTACPARRD
jgi:hypothetical protein